MLNLLGTDWMELFNFCPKINSVKKQIAPPPLKTSIATENFFKGVKK